MTTKQDNTMPADYPEGTHIAVVFTNEPKVYYYKQVADKSELYIYSSKGEWISSGFNGLGTLLRNIKKVVWATENLAPLIEAWYQAQEKVTHPLFPRDKPSKPSLPEPTKPNAPELCNRAANLLSERGKQYDGSNQERSMASTVAAFNAVYGTTMTELQGWHFMCLLKMVRQRAGGHVDSAEDLIAYAALAAETVHN